jgi:MFS transporter, PPP family, 3-phenylpropionic acid transporter
MDEATRVQQRSWTALEGPLPRLLVLYGLLYAAFGTSSPFFPAFLQERGISASELGVVLAAGTATRFLAGPLAGRLADRFRALRATLAIAVGLAALAVLVYLGISGFWLLLAVSIVQAAALAPVTPLADAIALNAPVQGGRKFEYGWVRGAGSAAFIAGTIAAGPIVDRLGLSAVVYMQASLLALAALATALAPRVVYAPPLTGKLPGHREGIAALLKLATFRRLMLLAALILGSHALHDGFAVIRWRAAGIDSGTIALLWSEAVAAEVVVFLLLGPPILRRFAPGPVIAFVALMGAMRWIVEGATVAVPAMALIQPIHGLTFALLHLTAMRVLAAIVPAELAGTAQTFYSTVGVALPSALLTLASGALYDNIGASGFLVMAGMCLAAMPLALGLRVTEQRATRISA